MIELFAIANVTVSREQISNWLKRDEDPDYKNCTDVQLASFLNGLITDKRGKQDGPMPAPEKNLNNNIVFRKLRIALNLQAEDILNIMALADLTISKHELSAFFRKPDHKHYRLCKDQILRNFIKGLQLKFRSAQQQKASFDWEKSNTSKD
jgi:uncharacterized protein YehS (DUF1456 family)